MPRNGRLYDALRDFALEAAAHLSAELEAGAELDFELAEEGRRGAVLYRYRPLTADFVRARWEALRRLPSVPTAAAALGAGAATYLQVMGGAGEADAEPALLAMLERLYEDATGFGFPEERFERVYAELEHTLDGSALRFELVAALEGLTMDCDRLELEDGLALVRGDLSEAPADVAWSSAEDGSALPSFLAVVERELPPGAEPPASEARLRLYRLVLALRLFKPGALGLGPSAWARIDAGPWRQVPLAVGWGVRGDGWHLDAGEEDELREFVRLAESWRASGRLAWALARFEMGCERPLDTEALTDYALALRALLDGADDAGRATLPLRVAALCADERDRRAVQRTVERAFALESHLMAGGSVESWLRGHDGEDPRQLVLELEEHLRALLRDLLCGYLDPDLKATADDILLRTEPFEVRARDLRPRVARAEAPEVEQEPEPAEPEPVAEPEAEPRALRSAPLQAGAPPPAPRREFLERGTAERQVVDDDFAWDVGEEPEDYSAPV